MTYSNELLLGIIGDLLPLAEAYLKDAPGAPENAALEDARAVLKGSASLLHGLTAAERRALRDAAAEALAGMFQGNIKALERAMEKLGS